MILEAAARVLGSRGYAATSTNRVAEVAGVSVGSLYQYFPNKEALVVALHQRHQRRVAQAVGEALVQARGLPLRDGIALLVRAMWKEHYAEPGLHQVLELEYPSHHTVRTGREAHVVRGLVRKLLEAYGAELRRPDLDVAAMVTLGIVRGLVHAAILGRHEAWGCADSMSEIVTAVMGYLTAESGGRGRAGSPP